MDGEKSSALGQDLSIGRDESFPRVRWRGLGHLKGMTPAQTLRKEIYDYLLIHGKANISLYLTSIEGNVRAVYVEKIIENTRKKIENIPKN